MSPTQPFQLASLQQMRGHARLTQQGLADGITWTFGIRVTQPQISQLEAGRLTDGFLQHWVSLFFRRHGYDADDRGAFIYVPPGNSAIIRT
jgi:hypothetical protein